VRAAANAFGSNWLISITEHQTASPKEDSHSVNYCSELGPCLACFHSVHITFCSSPLPLANNYLN
jgi:hypothetical protein